MNYDDDDAAAADDDDDFGDPPFVPQIEKVAQKNKVDMITCCHIILANNVDQYIWVR